ncbi:MAG: peptidoglycan-binding protein [Symploca sp. SIO1C2]|nr:peptidoglycan-binding protein [Symploca sp. SIO1C2]
MNTITITRLILKQGSTGKDVQDLQVILNSTGANLVIDSVFGVTTLQAVIAFQKQNNLTVDGIVSFQTWSKLESTTGLKPILRCGSRGVAVSYLQRYLNGLGFGHLVVDGIFGPATEKSVKKLQTFYDLTVDGMVGKETWSTIFNIL